MDKEGAGTYYVIDGELFKKARRGEYEHVVNLDDGDYDIVSFTFDSECENAVYGVRAKAAKGGQRVKLPVVRVTLTSPDGEVLDTFFVAHWRRDLFQLIPLSDAPFFDAEDVESVGSKASEAMLCERVSSWVESL